MSNWCFLEKFDESFFGEERSTFEKALAKSWSVFQWLDFLVDEIPECIRLKISKTKWIM